MADTSANKNINNSNSEQVQQEQLCFAPKRMRALMHECLSEGSFIQSVDEQNTPKKSRMSLDSPFKFVRMLDLRLAKHTETITNTIKELENKLCNVETKIQEVEANLSQKLEEKLKSIETEIDKVNKRVDALEQKSIEVDTDALKNDIKALKIRIQREENSKVACDLRINGVPFAHNENLCDIFGKICYKININIPQIKSIYRLQNENNRNKLNSPNAVIIVTMMSPYDKNFFLKSFSQHRKNNKNFYFTLQDLGFESNTKFYVNENLTTTNYKLFKEAIKLRNANRVYAAYTRHGLVYIKTSATDQPICIEGINELNELDNLFRPTSPEKYFNNTLQYDHPN